MSRLAAISSLIAVALAAASSPALASSIDGVVYDVVSGLPLAGARVELRFDALDAGSANAPVPATNLGDGQQRQITDSSGRYRFDISGVGINRIFRIVVITSATTHVFPSTGAPPRPGLAPAGPVVGSESPTTSTSLPRPYYLRFGAADNSYAVSNNHIPLDRLSASVTLAQAVSRSRAEVGDIVTFRFSGENGSQRDLTTVTGREIFLRIAPPRGFDVVGGSATARIVSGEVSERVVLASRRVTGGNRLLQLGPIDLLAGARFEVELRAVVGVDTRPGKTLSRGFLVDAGGVAISAAADANVEIDGARTLESSFVVGRVFCDSDGDGAMEDGDRGVFGARVFLDTGSFVITDADGLFRFTRVSAGTRLVKIDVGSLGSSTLHGGETRLLRMTAGLAEKVVFPVDCSVERIAGASGQVELSHISRRRHQQAAVADQLASRRLVVSGDLLLLAVKLDDEELLVPAASARLEAPASIVHAGAGGTNLAVVPAGGYGADRPRFVLGFQPPAGVASSRWTFVIRPATGSSSSPPIFQLSGAGAPPAAIDWDGRGNNGTLAPPDQLYAAQLVVIGSGAKTEAASALVPFGIDYGRGSSGPTSLTWRGALFAGGVKTPTSTPALIARIEALRKTLGPGDKLRIEVHSGRIRDRLSAIAATGRRAELIRSLLAGRPIPGDRIIARGRGSSEPLATGTTAASVNARVEVTIERQGSGHAGGQVPSAMTVPVSALIDGQPVDVAAGGRFRWEGAVPERGAVLIDVQAQDGRRGAIEVSLGRASRRPNRRGREVELGGDLDEPTVTVGGSALDARLLEVDVRAIDDRGAAINMLAPRPDGSLPPLHLEPVFDKSFTPRRAEIVITGGSGRELARLDVRGKKGARWIVPPAASAHQSVVAQLIIELADGTRAYSAQRSIGIGVEPAADVSRSAQLMVNGVTWPLAQGAIRGTATVPEGGAMLVDVTRSSGQRALYVVVLGQSDAIGAFSPEATNPPILGRVRRGMVTASELGASAAADFWLELPPAGGELSRSQLAVRGFTRSGNRLTINSVAVRPAEDGTFTALVPLAPGRAELVVENRDRAGFVARLRWPLVVRERQLFYMALGEVALSTSITSRGLFGDTAYLAGMTPHSSAAVGPLLLHGRASLYLKGELSAAPMFSRVRFTAHLDTARRRSGAAFFEDVLDPHRDQPTLGDDSIEVRDASGRGKLYLRVQADESEAVLGSLVGEVGTGQLFRYSRTVDGAAVNVVKAMGSGRVEVDAFASSAGIESRRDHVWYRSTGGSLYYLRFAQVLEGSEVIRLVVRDRDSGMIAREKILRRNTDYTIDYQSGRFWLIEPAPMAETSQWVLGNLEASTTPDSGNPVYIDARYEHRDGSGRERAAGVEAIVGIDKRLQIGAGAAGESRDGSGDYSLLGAHASYKAGERSRVEAELSASKRREGATLISSDGGLSFRDLGATAAAENPDADLEAAWRVGVNIEGGDFAGGLEGARLRIYGQGIDRGFSGVSTELERGRLKLGIVGITPLGATDQLILRHQTEIADVPRLGPRAADIDGDLGLDPLALDERSTYLTSLGWTTRHGRFVHQIEAAHQRLVSTATDADGDQVLDARRIGIGGRSILAFTPRLHLKAFQEVWVATRQSDTILNPIDPLEPAFHQDDPLAGITSGVGLEWRVLEDASVLSELRQRWNGDQAASVGIRARLSELGSFYVAERAERTESGPRSVTVIGAEDRFAGDSLGTARSYGEYQIEAKGAHTRNRAVLGLGRSLRLTPRLGIGLGFEHQQVFGGFLPDGTAIGDNQRDLIRASLDYTHGSRLRVGVVGELRADRGQRGSEVDRSIVDPDPRDVAGADGFADHGGVAPGAPLVLAAGEITQVVGSAGLTWKPERGLTVFGRARGSRSWRDDSFEPGPTRFGFAEITSGVAARSLLSNKLALVLRYSYLVERRPDELTRDASESAHVLAAVPIADLSRHFRLSGKLAWKRSEVDGGLASSASIDAILALVRLGARVFGNWDATVEGRALRLSGDNSELRVGNLVEIGYAFDKFLRFGVGYNFSHFNDDELGDLTRDAHGLFIRLTAEL